MRKIPAAHRSGGHHGVGLGDLNAGLALHIEQLPQGFLFRVIRARGISRRRPNPLILFRNQLFIGQPLFRCVAPEFAAYSQMQTLRERLRQSIGQRLQ